MKKIIIENKEDAAKAILFAASILKNKGTLIFPTDTVYGLGCIPNKDAISKIYDIKKRDKSKKIIALINDLNIIYDIIDLEKYSEKEWNNILKILKFYWPGNLTIILKANKDFMKKLGAYNSDETIGIRIPNNDFLLDLIRSGSISLEEINNIFKS